MDRTEEWWRHREFRHWETDPYVYIWERDGDQCGYVKFFVDNDGGERELRVTDIAYVDTEAYLNCLRMIYNYRAQISAIVFEDMPDDRLLDMGDPDQFEVTVDYGPVFRFIDIAQGLRLIDCADSTGQSIVIEVNDPLMSWNNGPLLVDFDGDSVHAEFTDEPPQAEIDIGLLSQLAIGSRSVEDARMTGDLQLDDESAAVLSNLCPDADPFFRERI